MNLPYQDCLPEVLAIADEAANAIMGIAKRKSYSIHQKLDASPVTEADLAAHTIIAQGLSRLTPSLPILSEEGPQVPFDIRQHWPHFWLVDPLDGTREFIQGSQEFTVNIALIENHSPLLGVIVAPALQQRYWAVRDEGAYMDLPQQGIQSLQTARSSASPIRLAVSRNFHLKHIEDQLAWAALKERLGEDCETIPCGSSLKFCLIAKGYVDLYPRFGTTCEWDIAAGQCILEAAGGKIVDTQGKPFRYNLRETLHNPSFYAAKDSRLASRCCG